MKRFKKPKQERYSLSKAEIKELCKEQVEKAFLLMVTATADELGLSDDAVCAIAERASRYSEYIDDKVVRLNEVSIILERSTGIKWKW